MHALTQLWAERLEYLAARRASGAEDGWYCAVEWRVLRFFLRNHGKSPPARAKQLDSASAEHAARVTLNEDVRQGLERTGDASWSRSSHAFRNDDELAAMDEQIQRRLRFRRYSAARVSFLSMAFLMFVTFVVSACIILKLYRYW